MLSDECSPRRDDESGRASTPEGECETLLRLPAVGWGSVRYRSIAQTAEASSADPRGTAEIAVDLARAVELINPTVRAFCAPGDLSAGASSSTPGPLSAVSVGVKDVFDVRGYRTTGNSRLFADRVAERTAPIVQRLLDAGCLMVGKTTLYELGSGREGEGLYPPAVNPWDPQISPGGSSSGSAAAVAAGMCQLGVGTDTGGSVRIPAAYCGIVGFKPTHGLLDCSGAVPGSSATLNDVGLLAMQVADIRTVLDALVDHQLVESEAGNTHLAGPTDGWAPVLGVPTDLLRQEQAAGNADESVIESFETACAELVARGFEVRPVDLPYLDEATRVGRCIARYETARELLPHRKKWSLIGESMRAYIDEGMAISTRDYRAAIARRHAMIASSASVFDFCDVILMPTTLRAAPPLLARRSDRDKTYFTRFDSVTGRPSISIPIWLTPHRLPFGLLISGARGRDRAVLDAAAVLEPVVRGDTGR